MRTNHRSTRTATRLGLAATALTATVVLTACGNGDSSNDAAGHSGMAGMSSSASASGSSSAVSKQHNDADVTFAQQMTVHHQEAVRMADLADTRASNAQVKDLATQIKDAQGPEITTMTGWLTAWGASTSSGMSGMDHDMSNMPGGMSDQDMDALAGMSGADFDRSFLTMMISHHQGAVDMAKTEQASGSSPEAKALAAKIITDQTAQISQMQTLLTQV